MHRLHLLHRLPIAVARVIFVFVVGAIATAAGTVLALTQTVRGGPSPSSWKTTGARPAAFS